MWKHLLNLFLIHRVPIPDMIDKNFVPCLYTGLLNFTGNKGRIYLHTILLLILNFGFIPLYAQSLPLGTRVLEDYYRRSQLLGDLDSAVSFTIRPLFPFSIDTAASFYEDSLLRAGLDLYGSGQGKKGIQILPVSWQQQYHSHPAYSWNDAAMIPAKGYQTLLSAGVFANYGPLSIQLKPEYVFAGNEKFNKFRSYYGSADLPVRFGNDSYSRLSWGQSSVRLNFDPVSIGLSNENLWWGPGIRNSLLMSNTAAGFKHLTLNTTRPIKTPLGSIEAQIIAGRLEGSGYTDLLPDDWRYLSGLAFSFQPRWFPGLFLGLTRSFQIYSKDMDQSFGDYLPFFQAFQKVNTNEDSKRRDQLTSVFARWLLTNSKAEVYFEYGLNDHSYNTRDFLMSPEHSRAYTLGMNKLISYKGRSDEYIQIGVELTHMEQSLDRILRDAGEWYLHSQVVHGYTNRGEVLGAGIGPGGNFQSLNVSWVKGLKQIGLQLERYEHKGDLPNAYGYGPWIDFSAAAVSNWTYKKFLLSSKLQGIQSVNYQWRDGLNGRPKQNIFNINAEIGITYRF